MVSLTAEDAACVFRHQCTHECSSREFAQNADRRWFFRASAHTIHHRHRPASRGWEAEIEQPSCSLCHCEAPWGGSLIRIRLEVQLENPPERLGQGEMQLGGWWRSVTQLCSWADGSCLRERSRCRGLVFVQRGGWVGLVEAQEGHHREPEHLGCSIAFGRLLDR